MSAIEAVANASDQTPVAPSTDVQTREAAQYIYRRLVDTLLREDVQGLVTRSQVVTRSEAPFESTGHVHPGACWLRQTRANGKELWLLVQPSAFMQPWRTVNAVAACFDRDSGAVWLEDYPALLHVLAEGLAPDAAELYQAYRHECDVAVGHRLLCERERLRWFTELQAGDDRQNAADAWAERFLFHDRLASFLDHPFYPTARAKLGLSESDLKAYAPEFQSPFELRWLAVPHGLFEGTLEPQPSFWPSFEQIGLPAHLAQSHVLMPVHPCLWQHQLVQYLTDNNLDDKVIRAPCSAVKVRPTLSVRTLIVESEPFTHIKVPLAMRSLGSKNIRTVKPSTIGDGHRVQSLLRCIAEHEPSLGSGLCLTDEGRGGHGAGQSFLGFILRAYPAELAGATLVSVAGLVAEQADGRSTIEALAERFHQGQLDVLWQEYVALTLNLHLRLWLGYGIALESNQQNSMLALEPGRPLRLLLKDNDAPRIWLQRLSARNPDFGGQAEQLQDQRILARDEQALAQMFITITLQLNLAVPLEGLIERSLVDRASGYRALRQEVDRQLRVLEGEGLEVGLARRLLLEEPTLPAKYLLRAGSLESKASTGATDINKFYGNTAPNFLRDSAGEVP